MTSYVIAATVFLWMSLWAHVPHKENARGSSQFVREFVQVNEIH